MSRATRIAALKAEWAMICRDMNSGAWNGTEADALARIEAIKRQLSSLEQSA